MASADKKSDDITVSWAKSVDKSGEYKRKESAFRQWIKADGSTPFPPEKGRYHLYVSYACPWACRTLALRKIKGLEDFITFTVVDWFLGDGGWHFNKDRPDTVNGAAFLKEIYLKSDPTYSSNITVPTLFDKKAGIIVNNESSEILRMFNSEFNGLLDAEHAKIDLYPEALRPQIDEINEWVYPNINNGVYRCGFAKSQEAYETAFNGLFDHLDKVEEILSKKRYLTGDTFTEADLRLFVTLIRFDAVYVVHFKCNKRQIREYPNMYQYVKEIYQMPGIKETVNFEHIKNHYYQSHNHINPFRITPLGPDLSDLEVPHTRGGVQK